jgi:hypothetical protein
MSCVVDHDTISLLEDLHRDHPDVFSSDPTGTIHFLRQLVELRYAMLDLPAMLRYRTSQDSRLLRCIGILQEWRYTMNLLQLLWNDPKSKQHFPDVPSVDRLFISPQSVQAMHVCIMSMVGLIDSARSLIGPDFTGISFPTTGM